MTIKEQIGEFVAHSFMSARTTSVQPLLEILAGLVRTDMVEEGRYAA